MSEVSEFLANVPREGTPLGAEASESDKQEEEAPAAAPTEEKQAEQDPSSEGDNSLTEKPAPFHKDPRWKAMYEDNKKLRATVEELSEQISDVAPKVEALSQSKSPTIRVPQWWMRLYGDSDESITAFSEYQSEQSESQQRLKDEARQELFQEQRQAQEEEQQRLQWVDQSVQELHGEGLQFDDNELKAIMLKYEPATNGRLDFRKGYELLQQSKELDKNPEKSKARKEMAAGTLSDKRAEEKSRDFYTHDDLKGGFFEPRVKS